MIVTILVLGLTFNSDKIVPIVKTFATLNKSKNAKMSEEPNMLHGKQLQESTRNPREKK